MLLPLESTDAPNTDGDGDAAAAAAADAAWFCLVALVATLNPADELPRAASASRVFVDFGLDSLPSNP